MPLPISAGVLLALAAALPAQAGISKSFFRPSHGITFGGVTQSNAFRLIGTGDGSVPQRATSPTFALAAGYAATLDVQVTGRPWAGIVTPSDLKLRSQAPLAIRGTELDLGPPPNVTVGGQACVIGSRTKDQITTTLPLQFAPGPQPVEVQSTLGTTTLPEGVKILPYIDTPSPVTSRVPFALRLHGAQGDQLVWAIALAKGPATIALFPFWHGFELDLATFVALPASAVTDPSGVLSLPLPAVFFAQAVYVQAFVLSQDPGYAPGSFTNVIKLD